MPRWPRPGRPRFLDPEVCQQARSPDCDLAPFDRGLRTATGKRPEPLGRGPWKPSRVGGSHDRFGEGVFGVGLHRRREREEPGLIDARRWRDGRDRGLPVSVPVLSKMTVSSSRARSRASRSFTRSPFRAPRLVEIAITSGMARPRACGQAMTRTVAGGPSRKSPSPTTRRA